MAKYLINVTETYRLDSEAEVEALLEEAKQSKEYELNKYNCVYKETKQKGEVVDSWYRLTLTKNFTSEKEPERSVDITYGKLATFDPVPLEEVAKYAPAAEGGYSSAF
jgi:hypothetical protein